MCKASAGGRWQHRRRARRAKECASLCMRKRKPVIRNAHIDKSEECFHGNSAIDVSWAKENTAGE